MSKILNILINIVTSVTTLIGIFLILYFTHEYLILFLNVTATIIFLIFILYKLNELGEYVRGRINRRKKREKS